MINMISMINNIKKKNMKKNIYKTIIAAMCIFPACSDYLDIVPDKSFTLENIFSTRSDAYNALAKIYSYLPTDSKQNSYWLLGDEWVNPLVQNTNYTLWQPIRIMERRQVTDEPFLGTWSKKSTGGGKPLYEAINTCNIFISMIDGVRDMEPDKKEDWKAQATFLKAYYHFLLLRQYGPIVLMDKVVTPDDDPASLYASRSKIDACFKYIVETLDAAIPNLLLRRTGNELGQIDRLGAASIKARVLLFRASKFYSGNDDYSDFLDHDGQPFFPQDNAERTKAKWEDAVTAINTAITLCEGNEVALFKYTGRKLPDDTEDATLNPVNMQRLYDLRMVICDRWNEELIWGNSNVVAADNDLFSDGNIVLPIGYTGVEHGNTYACRNYLGATYKTLERYYTKNGLPLDEDNTFDRSTMHELTRTPGTGDAAYAETRGILQPDVETINLYLNREPRFYANVGITGGYWRSHSVRIRTSFYADAAGGFSIARPNNFFWTAIGAQKQVHIDNMVAPRNLVVYPTPIIRLADLYLMKAEALNETLSAPNGEVYEAINKVRRRAGIPDVEAAYTGSFVKSAPIMGKHLTQIGMREIIRQERAIEFAFEGHIFWDMLRYGKAPEEFSTPVLGWNYGAIGADFFQQKVIQPRMFTLRDCLWPIDLGELDKNSNLIQNPGW
ncbi:membrane protein [Bacteroidia bacterium]|nr:membrane protein [Bacteroidia bacterium]